MMRLRIRQMLDNEGSITAELKLPAPPSGIFTLSPNAARQLAGHLIRLAALCEEVSAVSPAAGETE